jgi:hypothetical protein
MTTSLPVTCWVTSGVKFGYPPLTCAPPCGGKILYGALEPQCFLSSCLRCSSIKWMPMLKEA